MDESAIWNALTSTFRDVFEDDTLVIRPETTARDIAEWDSLTHIQLLVAIEQAFGVRFNTGEVAGFANVGDMVALIGAKQSGRSHS